MLCSIISERQFWYVLVPSRLVFCDILCHHCLYDSVGSLYQVELQCVRWSQSAFNVQRGEKSPKFVADELASVIGHDDIWASVPKVNLVIDGFYGRFYGGLF